MSDKPDFDIAERQYAEIRDLRAKLQAAEARADDMTKAWGEACGDADAAEAEVARLKESHKQDRHEIGEMHSRGDRLFNRIAELEALAAENDAAYRTWRRRCEAADSRIAELEAELLGAMREKEDVRRTATEDALRFVQKRWPHFYLNESDIRGAIKALLGEDAK